MSNFKLGLAAQYHQTYDEDAKNNDAIGFPVSGDGVMGVGVEGARESNSSLNAPT